MTQHNNLPTGFSSMRFLYLILIVLHLVSCSTDEDVIDSLGYDRWNSEWVPYNQKIPGRNWQGDNGPVTLDVEIIANDITFDRGECLLDMRVYRKAGLGHYRPLLYIHGGGWKNRSYHDIEKDKLVFNTASLADDNPAADDGALVRLLDLGYIVYASDFRLANGYQLDDETIPAVSADQPCETRGNLVIDDVRTVLEGIYTKADWLPPSDRSATPVKVVLWGQSSGGHIAHYLAINHPEMVHKFLNNSGPVSFQFFRDNLADSKRFAPAGFIPMQSFILSIEEQAQREILFEKNPNPINISDAQTCQCKIPAFIETHTFADDYDKSRTPPGYIISNRNDLFIYYKQGDEFCRYVAAAHGIEFDVDAPDQIIENQKRKIWYCGANNVLDRGYSKAVSNHGIITEGRFVDLNEWLEND